MELTALAGLFGLSSAFALVGAVLAGWMAWRIVEKAGLPGWAGLGAIALTLTGIGSVVPLVLLWVFAFMRWPRDDQTAHATASAPLRIAAPPKALADRRRWKLEGGGVALVFDESSPSYRLTAGPATEPTDLVVPGPAVGVPHARLLTAAGRLGLEDLGSPGGTWIDGARLLPEHGPRDISAVRSIRVGSVELALSRV